MKKEKNQSSEIVMIDMDTISNALKSLREKEAQGIEVKESKEEIKADKPKITPRYRNTRNSLISGLDLQPIIKKINDLQPIINNNDDLFIIDKDKYGYKNLYIDEDGKDTLDPPSGRSR